MHSKVTDNLNSNEKLLKDKHKFTLLLEVRSGSISARKEISVLRKYTNTVCQSITLSSIMQITEGYDV